MHSQRAHHQHWLIARYRATKPSIPHVVKLSVPCVCTLSLYHRRHRQSPARINWPVLLPSRQLPTFHFQCKNSKRAQGDSVEQRRHGVDLYAALGFCGGARTVRAPTVDTPIPHPVLITCQSHLAAFISHSNHCFHIAIASNCVHGFDFIRQ